MDVVAKLALAGVVVWVLWPAPDWLLAIVVLVSVLWTLKRMFAKMRRLKSGGGWFSSP